jgi:hypothetical protein
MSKPDHETPPLTPDEEAYMHGLIDAEMAPYVAAGTHPALLQAMREQAENAFRTHPDGRRLLAASVRKAAPDASGDVRRDGAPEISEAEDES